jgi:hypothetical protein
MNVANKNLINELESLEGQLKQNNESDYMLKINQQQDGSVNFAVYADDNLLCESLGDYKIDYSDNGYQVSCRNDHCKRIIEYGLTEDATPGSKVRVEEKYDSHSDHFNVNLAFYDESGNAVGKYGTELSYQQSQDPGSEGYNYFIIHDLFAV